AESSRRGAEPRVVAPLELLEQLGKQLRAVELSPPPVPQRGGRTVDLLRQLLAGEVDVDADPEHDPALARLGQDPGDLAAAAAHVVGELDLRLAPRQPTDH